MLALSPEEMQAKQALHEASIAFVLLERKLRIASEPPRSIEDFEQWLANNAEESIISGFVLLGNLFGPNVVEGLLIGILERHLRALKIMKPKS
jgi:hypothetical protein